MVVYYSNGDFMRLSTSMPISYLISYSLICCFFIFPPAKVFLVYCYCVKTVVRLFLLNFQAHSMNVIFYCLCWDNCLIPWIYCLLNPQMKMKCQLIALNCIATWYWYLAVTKTSLFVHIWELRALFDLESLIVSLDAVLFWRNILNVSSAYTQSWFTNCSFCQEWKKVCASDSEAANLKQLRVSCDLQDSTQGGTIGFFFLLFLKALTVHDLRPLPLLSPILNNFILMFAVVIGLPSGHCENLCTQLLTRGYPATSLC